MNVARPYSSVAPTVDGDVLVVLARTVEQMSGRQVARLVRRGSQPAVNAALDRLVSQGLVRRAAVPPALLYSLNRDHLAYPAVEALANLRAELIGRLQAAFDVWKIKPVHASLYGSTARGDGDDDSDIDVFIVRPGHVNEENETWQRQLDTFSGAVEAWTGNQVSLIEFSDARVTTMARDALAPMLADGILLSGAGLEDLIETADIS
jgi:predicted nucleotidyltransferase